MANKMLIDASHPEETRVVVLRGNRIEEFDFESASKKPLRGNIYLAKVTRVEPSLQAAFIEYGGNRHGFLAFSEIHPDYYQIPVADRQALLEEEQRQHAAEEEEEARPQRRSRRRRRNGREKRTRDDVMSVDAQSLEDGHHGASGFEAGSAGEQPFALDAPQPGISFADADAQPVALTQTDGASAQSASAQASSAQAGEPAPAVAAWTPLDAPAPAPEADQPAASQETVQAVAAQDADGARPRDAMDHERPDHEGPEAEARRSPEGETDEADEDDEDEDEDEEEEHVEQIGGDDVEEMPVRVSRQRRQYKIQEVIRRRQVLLVQVVKEERGNKGAALTTYLSLAGRYSVLMPNTARGGGISRKITDNEDRKRLKEIASELEVPDGMGVILRTAGASRTKQEVRRDFEYLLRMWESVRELTLESTAPSLVYEEGSLIKRSIRDLYGKEIDEVVVSGDEGFKEARDYMGMLMPSHVRNVKPWREPQPLFARMGVEAQLDSMFSNQVTLKSGGYIVINQTEALVAIDVNSGRSTREHNIEDTALRTNLEAADEVARQLRLRDLAGLIVVDFIDMEEHRNNRAVERRLKEALKNDRARIQVGRISHFGLLEMSRQRMRTGVLEGSSVVCPHCQGAGTVRSTASMALHVLRVIEDALVRNAQYNLTARTRTLVALYILNQKRSHLRELEERFGVTIVIEADDALMGGVYHALERGELAVPPPAAPKADYVRLDSIAPMPEYEDEDDSSEDEDEDSDEDASAAGDNGDGQGENGRRRRRRRRRRGRDRDPSGIDPNAPQPSDDALAAMAAIGGDLPGLGLPAVGDGEVDDAQAEQEGEDALARSEEDGRRRRRRRGRGGRNGERAERSEDAAESPGRRGPGAWVRSSDHAEPDFAVERAPADLTQDQSWQSAPVAQSIEIRTPASAQEEPASPAPQAAAVVQEPAPAPTPEPAPAPREPDPLPEAPAPSQKKSGWWSRAKTTFTGG